VETVFQKDTGYYNWMMEGDFPLDTKRRLTEIKLRTAKMKK
jgi:DNA polymerase-3 subunit epsilon